MKYLYFLVFLLIVSRSMGQSHLWKNRVLEISGSNKELITKQVSLFEKKVLDEYKLKIVLKNTQSHPFEIKLIGLDGSTKSRKTQITEPHYFYQLIESMPMRQAEKSKN